VLLALALIVPSQALAEYTIYFVDFACPICGKFAMEKGKLAQNERILPLPEINTNFNGLQEQKVYVGENYLKAYYVLTKYRPKYEKKIRVALFKARSARVKDKDLPEWLDLFMPIINWKEFFKDPAVNTVRYMIMKKTIKLFEKVADKIGDKIITFPIIAVLDDEGKILTIRNGEGSWR